MTKAVILAGGMGSRLSEETTIKPKPMVEIGGYPILWHIMKIYSAFGIHDFIICLGYRGYAIKEYFAHYFLHMSDITLDIKNNQMTMQTNLSEPWTVTLLNTGLNTMTGGRIKYAWPYLKDEELFCLTYGDGVADINIDKLIHFHKTQGKLATITAVHPQGRFGVIELEGNQVTAFEEKPQGEGGFINGGFFVLSPKVLDLIEDDHTVFEKEPLETLARTKQLAAYRHEGFWQPMDMLRDKLLLEQLWNTGKAPWKQW